MTTAAVPRILLGIGNWDRGDDAVGRVVAQRVRDLAPPDVLVVEHDGEATSLLARLEGMNAAVIVDACCSGQPAGTVQRFDVNRGALPSVQFGLSTHSFGLDAAIELARALEQLPRRCVVYAIEGQSFDTCAGLSPAVAAAVRSVAERVLVDLTEL